MSPLVPSYMSEIERGVRYPSVLQLLRLAAALGVPLTTLF
jgi:transcriptional regulator with XRE-family HTH domain